ncbi:uncharacterized protein Z519_06012 [Cladophialophora bantiana CBS 173.52]|uniref:Cytochrome P450 n=1 Tax=Cladophialophora bantiana (strain ATCC 10958 / CBS 173.52 / CDC B-1940 / NIH 8579) TaxID=1442370 RepID=A0A0D2G414_CLAB1|nr:uncharacterized protein Z519_06012 [Cladophialophora bantiana CBS 173.52]KIW93407.1 hypothetical protein Z519_06012 [Cladophialophora bantiana CBS 173.52]
MACIEEIFRINPAFTLTLTRKVTAQREMTFDGHFVPSGTTIFSSNHVMHHDPAIWGPTHDVYDPNRFLGPNAELCKRNLAPFSMVHRVCMGRNMAMINILKVVTTVLKCSMLESTNPKEKMRTVSVGNSEKEGPLVVQVRRQNLTGKPGA